MPSILFICLPLEGHLRPLVNVAAAAQSLAPEGTTIEFAALEQNRKTIEGMGVAFASLGALTEEQRELCGTPFVTNRGPPSLYNRAKGAAGIFTNMEGLMYPMVKAFFEQRTGSARPDLLVIDQATMAAHNIAAELGLPVVQLHQLPLSYSLYMAGRHDANGPRHVPVELPGCVLPERMSWIQKLFVNPGLKRSAAATTSAAYAEMRDASRAKLGLTPLPPGSAPYQLPPGVPRSLHIVSGSMELEVERPLPEGWHMLGPVGVPADMLTVALDPAKDAEVAAFLSAAQAANEPVVYVALGSGVAPHKELVEAMASAFERVPSARFLWSLNKASHPHLPAHLAPAAAGDAAERRVLVSSWVPQTAVLVHPSVAMFVSHVGLGSLYEGLSAGKRLLAMPFFADQHINAQHLANKGLGATVDASAAAVPQLAERLRGEISKLLADEGAKARTAELGERLRETKGAETAAKKILAFVAAA